MREGKPELLNISAQAVPGAIAGAVAESVRENGFVELQAAGADAVNQATKAVVIARGLMAMQGYDLICIPAFTDAGKTGEKLTAIKLIVMPR